MIKYALTCQAGHSFESWFQSASAFDALKAAGHVTCAHCGSDAVDKTIMAPAVAKDVTPPKPDPKLAALRDKVEREADYVGPTFATEARAIHEGTAPERPIYGEATGHDARALLEDGVPVMPLPFVPRKKAH